MEQINKTIFNETVDQIKIWSHQYPTQEMCGFLGFDDSRKEYVISLEDNIAQDPQNYFAISPVRFLKFKSTYKMMAVWHSHIYGSEEPSLFDERMAEGCQYPFFIYSCQTKTTGIFIPENSKHEISI